MAPFIRIALNIIAGVLIGRGWVSPDAAHVITHNPELVLAIETVIGVLVLACTNAWYLIARRFGWRT